MLKRTKFRLCISVLLAILLFGISQFQSFSVSGSRDLNAEGLTDSLVAASPTPVRITSPYPTGYYDLECYVKPDFDSQDPLTLKNFRIELKSTITYTGYDGLTDEKGYVKFYAIGTIPWKTTISKPGFLTRAIDGTGVGTAQEPILMWAGDMNNDKTINMADIMEIAASFNTLPGVEEYNPVADFNADKAVNMADILIACTHFNKTADDYTSLTSTPSPKPTPTPYSIFHRMPYNVTTNLTTDTITQESADLSINMLVTNNASVSSLAEMIYWKKNNPEDKTSVKVSFTKDYAKNSSTSNCILSGLEANTAYCCQVSTNISPYGEIETAPYTFYWTFGTPEPYTSSVFEFNTNEQ
jgi:hypothetical protein